MLGNTHAGKGGFVLCEMSVKSFRGNPQYKTSSQNGATSGPRASRCWSCCGMRGPSMGQILSTGPEPATGHISVSLQDKCLTSPTAMYVILGRGGGAEGWFHSACWKGEEPFAQSPLRTGTAITPCPGTSRFRDGLGECLGLLTPGSVTGLVSVPRCEFFGQKWCRCPGRLSDRERGWQRTKQKGFLEGNRC